MASGPSLTASDVAACQGRTRVIAVNDSYRLAPWADVLYSSDVRWWDYYLGVPEFTGLKFGIQPLNPKPEWHVTVLRNTGDTGIEIHPSGLRTGRNSGAAAIGLAVHFGVSRIVLLGYDMGKANGKGHWFGEHPERLRAASPTYETLIEIFGYMVAPLQKLGVEVINCSRMSRLECFPKADLSDVLASCEVTT